MAKDQYGAVNTPEHISSTKIRAPQTWRFGPFVYAEARRELRRDGERLELEPKPLDVLACLLREADTVVSKETLAETVWARRLINDAVITKAIGKLRQTLGDNEQERIKTVYGMGYRLVGPVECLDMSADNPGREEPAASTPGLQTSPPDKPGSGASVRRMRQQIQHLRLAVGGLLVLLLAVIVFGFGGSG